MLSVVTSIAKLAISIIMSKVVSVCFIVNAMAANTDNFSVSKKITDFFCVVPSVNLSVFVS